MNELRKILGHITYLENKMLTHHHNLTRDNVRGYFKALSDIKDYIRNYENVQPPQPSFFLAGFLVGIFVGYIILVIVLS